MFVEDVGRECVNLRGETEDVGRYWVQRDGEGKDR